jgi:hypothetical protein
MAHFAKVNSNNKVEVVVVVSNCAIGSCIGPEHWDYQPEYHQGHDKGIDFPESEPLGQAVLAESGLEGTWLQTSYNGNFRGAYAGAGYLWDGTNFIPPVEEETTE